MLFGTTAILSRMKEVIIGHTFKRVSSYKNVGIKLDSSLKFHDHIYYIKGTTLCKIKLLSTPFCATSPSISMAFQACQVFLCLLWMLPAVTQDNQTHWVWLCPGEELDWEGVPSPIEAHICGAIYLQKGESLINSQHSSALSQSIWVPFSRTIQPNYSWEFSCQVQSLRIHTVNTMVELYNCLKWNYDEIYL